MKIYFEDGALNAGYDGLFNHAVRIDAGDGYSHCHGTLEHLSNLNFEGNVYTNFLPAISAMYSWNPKMNKPTVFIRYKGDFVDINSLTNRELRSAHNLPKMWENGEFRD